MQDDIAQSVVKELRRRLLGVEPDSKASGEVREEVAAAARGRGTDTEAHRLYLQGSFLIRRMTQTDLETGLEYLTRAVELDPGHARAWAWLSRGRTNQAGWGLVPASEGGARAREAAERALELEPTLADALVARGIQLAFHDWDWALAERLLEEALAIAPDDVEVLSLAGILMHNFGRCDAAVAYFRRAAERDPLNVLAYGGLGRACRGAGLLTEAEAAFRKELELSPQGVSARMRLALVLVAMGRVDEALFEARQDTADWARNCALGVVHHARGEAAESDAALETLIRDWAEEGAYQIAMVHGFRSEVDAAFEWLERSYDQRDSGLALMKAEPFFEPLHADPRWTRLLRKIGLPA